MSGRCAFGLFRLPRRITTAASKNSTKQFLLPSATMIPMERRAPCGRTLRHFAEASLDIFSKLQNSSVALIFQFWDRPSNRLVAEFDHSILVKDTRHPFVVQCEQFKTASLLLKRVQKLANVEVLFNHQVIDVWQASEFVSVDLRGPASMQTHAGAYLIGADGGRSTVRKRSEIAFDGFTWPERFIVLTTPFDFEVERGYAYRSYFADPGAWCNCFKVSADGPPGLWRTVFPTETNEKEADVLCEAGVQARLNQF